MNRVILAALLSALTLAACAKTKAPGTNPSDMTAAQHQEACAKHKKMAEAEADRAKEADGGKGTYTAEQRSDEHADVAKQHEDAAKQVDPKVDDCK